MTAVASMDPVASFLAIRHESSLRAFADAPPPGPLGRALGFYAAEYLLRGERPESATFDAGRMLAGDLSAVRHGDAPVIFLGTNDWALLRYETPEVLAGRIGRILPRLRQRLEAVTGPVHLTVIPEKDTVLEKLFFDGRDQAGLDSAVAALFEAVARPGLTTAFDEFLPRLRARAAPEDYLYADSHLLGRDYLQIFASALAGFGLAGTIAPGSFALERASLHGDLTAKFAGGAPRRESRLVPRLRVGTSRQIGGDAHFADPLRATWQRFHTPDAPIRASVALYGDSHCSIFAGGKLTALFAQAFERCSFFWNPLALGEGACEPADFTLFQISQRFLFGTPPGGGR